VTKKQIEVKQPDLTMLVSELIDELCVATMLLEEIRHLSASSLLTQARIYDRVAFHPNDAQTYKEAEDIVTDSYRRIKTVEDDQDETCGAAEDAKADDNGGVAA
jgi:hypothetical protein